ncbi:hypothetical protein [Cronobacter sakazakii]|uniref:hypothetical protein n=1 Tax=Cronobacter sakazakii TaxID=28141 RepID=UPI003FF08494
MTVELAAKLAQKDGRKFNGAIRATVNAYAALSGPESARHITGLARHHPGRCTQDAARQLDSMVGEPA